MTSLQEPAELAALANLIVGTSAGRVEDSAVVQEFFRRVGLGPAMINRILDRSIGKPPNHIVRLAALQLYLEKNHALDEKTTKAVRKIGRELSSLLCPPRVANTDVEFDVPFSLRKGALRTNQAASIESAVQLIGFMADELGVDDLSDKSVMDIGCGVKFTQAFYGRKLPVKRYHGVDVDLKMIEFLSSNVDDEKFSYTHIDIYNAMYHKAGRPLSDETDIGAKGQTFDLICLFSVFTHLAPTDYRIMLELARKYIAPTGTLIFTSFIDDTIPEDFKDYDPNRPLYKALYRESAVRDFAAAAKWSVRRIFNPANLQPWVVCDPA